MWGIVGVVIRCRLLGFGDHGCELGVLLVERQLHCSLVKPVVTPLHLSKRAACSNNQQCLKLTKCYCISVSTMLTDMPDHQVTIIAVTNGYTCFLSLPVSISLTYPSVVRCGLREVREERGVWNSLTTFRDVTNQRARTDRRLQEVPTLWNN
jgi:hypothetical protein